MKSMSFSMGVSLEVQTSLDRHMPKTSQTLLALLLFTKVRWQLACFVKNEIVKSVIMVDELSQ